VEEVLPDGRREDRLEQRLGNEMRHDLRVVARRGMTEEHGPEAGDLVAQRRGPRLDGERLAIVELGAAPAQLRSGSLGNRRRPIGPLFDRLAIAVAAQEVRRQVERAQTGERLARHGTGQHVAAHDDAIGPGAHDVGEHGVERRQVAMDIVEGGNAHRVILPCASPRSVPALGFRL